MNATTMLLTWPTLWLGMCVVLFAALGPPSVAASLERPDEQRELKEVDCAASYDRYLEVFGVNPYPRSAVPVGSDANSGALRERLVEVASHWAQVEGYLPCTFTMTACVLVDAEGNYGVYIGPSEATIEDEPGIYPAAAIFFRGDTEIVEEIEIIHSSCRAMRLAAEE